MIIEININCEDEKELLTHLSVIRKEIKRSLKSEGGEFKTPVSIEDSNCYGNHTINIIPEWYAEQDKWVSVKDRLPEPGDHVLICCSSQGIHKCFLDVLGKWRSSWDISLVQMNITHWQPLPELPKL